MEWKKNTELDLEIEGYSSEGLGVAHVEGRVVFVHRAVRGERCRVRLEKVLKNMAFARILSIQQPSPMRRQPDCPHYGRCGGCDFRHLAYEEELAAKRQRVDDALQRIGGLDLRTDGILGAEEILHYRNKALYPVSPEGKVGFFRSHSHEVVNVECCLLQKPEADAAAGAVRRWMAQYAVPGYDERKGTGLVRHLFVRSDRQGRCLICLLVNGEKLPREKELTEQLRRACPTAVGILLGKNTRRDNVILGESYRCLWGESRLTDQLCGLEFSLSVPSFYQVNRAQAQVLYDRAVEFAQLSGRETVLDLYCGTGTITLAMARQAGHCIGAEIVPQAIEDARANARRNGLEEKTEFFCADAAQMAAHLAAEGLRPEVICVDPPRKGLAPEVVDSICRMEPLRVVYVSCDPGTLARDLKLFAARGYVALRATAVDMFPRTVHVETVVLLSKGEVDSKKIRVEFSLEDMDMSEFQDGATYPQIKEYVLEHTGLKVSNLYISQIKRKCGIGVGKNYNLPKSEDSRQPQCPPEKEKAIREAFKYFGMI